MTSTPPPSARPGSIVVRLASWPSTPRGRVLSLVLAFLLVNVLLLVPQWVAPGFVPFQWIALEGFAIVGVFAFLPRRPWSLGLALLTALVVVGLAVIGLGDALARMSLSRPLNLYLDLRLTGSVSDLLAGTLGTSSAALVQGGFILGVLGAVAGLGHLLAPPRNVSPVRLTWRRAGVLAVSLVTIWLASGSAWVPRTFVGTPGWTLAVDQTRFLRALLAEREAFEVELTSLDGQFSDIPRPLSGLGGRDVILAFVESYGMTALDDPRYAPVILPRLEQLESRMRTAGLFLASGSWVAPSQGGQSWLGHGSVLSGLWLDNQMRYDLLLANGGSTLIDDFARAGYRTAALMPAITLAWPEGDRLGYEEIHTRPEIPYAGPPLNWVTMPDQFTWSYLERTVRRASSDGRPLFAEVGLISSHAPWTPILPVLDDWDGIGHGEVFEPWRDAGERPEDLWRDADRVREHYARSVAYALDAMSGWAERFAGDDLLLVVLGDHQPAPLITGDGAPRTVPVHVIAGSEALIEPFLDWGFTPGAFPPEVEDPPGMDRFRSWFVRVFSGGSEHPLTPSSDAGQGDVGG